jgi:acyl-CoA hydrolase
MTHDSCVVSNKGGQRDLTIGAILAFGGVLCIVLRAPCDCEMGGISKIVSAKKKTAIFRPVPHCPAVVKILVDVSTLIEKD